MSNGWLKGSAVVAAATLTIAGCASTPTSSPEPSASQECASADVTCIGLVLEGGSVDDGAFNAAAWKGVQDAARASGAVAEYVESADPQAYSANLAELADRGFDVVVTTDVGRPELTVRAATDHPDTHFVAISQEMPDTAGNATGLIFRDDEAGYAAGHLAGLMTETGVVGAVLGSEEVLPLRRFGEGFRQGVLAARPDATVLMDYHDVDGDSFNDPAWGAATAANQLAQGADLIFGAGGTTGTAALGAVAKLPEAGTSLFCLGIDTDQYETVPEARPCLLTSAEKKIAAGVSSTVEQVLAGEQLPTNVEGETGLAPYHGLESQVPDGVRNQVNAVIAGLASGEISTGVDF